MRGARRLWQIRLWATLALSLGPSAITACQPKCKDGREPAGAYCCWPGQLWSDARETCVGAPKCPDEMIGVGAATFHIGTLQEGKEWQASRPIREVKVDAFCLDRTEVTVAEYKKCVDAGTCKPPVYAPKGGTWVDKDCNTLTEERANYPANCLDWERAQAYCRWAGKNLPSEEEWQLAAGRMDGRKYPWGDDPPAPGKANLFGGDDEAGDPLYPGLDGYASTAPTGAFVADRGPFGHLDLGGNVSEWSRTITHDGMALLPGGTYSSRSALFPQLRYQKRGSKDLDGPMDGIRCARPSRE